MLCPDASALSATLHDGHFQLLSGAQNLEVANLMANGKTDGKWEEEQSQSRAKLDHNDAMRDEDPRDCMY